MHNLGKISIFMLYPQGLFVLFFETGAPIVLADLKLVYIAENYLTPYYCFYCSSNRESTKVTTGQVNIDF